MTNIENFENRPLRSGVVLVSGAGNGPKSRIGEPKTMQEAGSPVAVTVSPPVRIGARPVVKEITK